MNAPRCGKYMRTVLLNCGPIAHLDSGDDGPLLGSMVNEVEYLVSEDSGIVIMGDEIESIAESSELESEYLEGVLGVSDKPSIIQDGSETTVWNISGHAVIPGLVDSHTHLLWAGDRSSEVMLRQQGFSYSQIAEMGGGIAHTVHSTRGAEDQEILNIGRQRMATALHYGTTMIEAKSGYGLDTESELRLLRIAKELSRAGGLPDLDLTWLGAHAAPPSTDTISEENKLQSYVEEIISEQLPAVLEQGIARSADVFCEPGWFTIEQTEEICSAAISGGLDIRLHVDEFCDGGGMQLASELAATTADHAHHSPLDSRFAAKKSGTLQGFLLGTPHVMGYSMPPVSTCVENEIAFTIATDFNPNCHTLSMPFIGSLAVQRCGIDPLTTLVAATRNPASGIERDDGLVQGVLKRGAVANINILKSNNWESWCLQPGVSPIHHTYISGKPVLTEKTLEIK
ncbi:MAG: hypothetical protein NZ807_04430 [Dehalococcoidia bacterium]|nr:hypothetical protein [Dehalococcoidia bacterium]